MGRWRVTTFVLVPVALMSVAGWSWLSVETAMVMPLMVPASRSTLRVIVTERGNLESSKTVDGVCEVSGHQNKIIFIVPEGKAVKKDDVVVRFDTNEIEREISQQEIKVNQAAGKVETTKQEVEVQRNKGESSIQEAELELTLAKLDLDKYKKGEYEVEVNDRKGLIALAEVDLQKAKEKAEFFRKLVKKGLREVEQLRTVEQQVSQLEYYLERDNQKLRVLQDYDYTRKTTELEGKSVQAEQKLIRARASSIAELAKLQGEHEAAKSTLNLEQQQLEKLKKEKEKCIIVAQQDGVVAYANEYWYSSDRQIREGAVVHSRQKIFSLPDMSSMQAKVNVHESLVKKVQPGQKVDIRVDAFPNIPLAGVVKSVSPLADSTRSWMSGGVKEYTTVVDLDPSFKADLKPGMTAEVKILVNEIPSALVVPVQAVTEHAATHYAYVKAGQKIERRKVSIGDSNQKMVQILEGISEADMVALDARARGIADFKDDNSSDDAEENKESKDGKESKTEKVAEVAKR